MSLQTYSKQWTMTMKEYTWKGSLNNTQQGKAKPVLKPKNLARQNYGNVGKLDCAKCNKMC